MRPIAIQAPPFQEQIFGAIWRSNPLKTRPRLMTGWPATESLCPGARIPVIWLHNGACVCDAVTFGWSQGQEDRRPLTIEAEGKSIARRCIVPVTSIDVEEAGHTYRISPGTAEYLLLGAQWLQANQYGVEPYSIALLTTAPPTDQRVPLSRGLIAISETFKLAWMDACRDTIPMQAAAKPGIFEIVEIDRAVAA